MNKFLKYTIPVFGLVLLIGLALKGNIIHQKFDAEKWKNWTESETELSTRWDMMNALRNNYQLKGKPKAEIIDLLGKPEHQANSSFRYYLGMSGHGINTGSLIIEFDENNLVTNFIVLQG